MLPLEAAELTKGNTAISKKTYSYVEKDNT